MTHASNTQSPTRIVSSRGALRPLLTRLALVLAAGGSGACNDLQFERSLDPASRRDSPYRDGEVMLQLPARYLAGELFKADLYLGTRDVRDPDGLYVVVSSQETGDREDVRLELNGQRGSWLTTTLSRRQLVRVAQSDGNVQPQDHVLELSPGEKFTAYFTPPPDHPGFRDLREVVSARAEFQAAFSDELNTAVVESSIALPTDPESEAIKESGTFSNGTSPRVQIALHDLIVWVRDDDELAAFLTRTNGKLAGKFPLAPASRGESAPFVALVQVEPPAAEVPALRSRLRLLGLDDAPRASRPEVHALVSLVLQLKLEGWAVSVNPRHEPHGPPALDPNEAVDSAMRNGPAGCIPGDPKRVCILNTEAAWSYAALWDRTSPVNVAVLDTGFARNVDFRLPAMGAPRECDFSGNFGAERCEPGAAEGRATSAATHPWHGTGVVEVLGGVLGNGQLGAGVAGQIAVPMLYRYGGQSYAFELGAALQRATNDGASVVNLSAGYPCHALAGIGPDLDACSTGGRALLCGSLRQRTMETLRADCDQLRATGSASSATLSTVCAAAAGTIVSTSPLCSEAERFGNARSPIVESIHQATERGIPVVVSAGNAIRPDALPESLRAGFQPAAWSRVEQVQMMPAMIPETISVGAVDPATLQNRELYGVGVDMWAPASSTWFAPNGSDVAAGLVRQAASFGATSAAAPFVAGTIAMMQAIAPELDPNSTFYVASTAAEARRALVARVTSLLRDHSWSDQQLASFGYDSQPETRPLLIDPLRLVREAGRGSTPDLALLGYDQTLGHGEQRALDDVRDSATQVVFRRSNEFPRPQTFTGTILDGTAPIARDVDWYEITRGVPMSSEPFPDPWQSTVVLRYPPEFGDLDARGTGLVRMPEQTGPAGEVRFTAVASTDDATVAFAVAGLEDDDNVYRLEVSPPVPAVPTVAIVPPKVPVCAHTRTTVTGSATFPGAPAIRWSDDNFRWEITNQDPRVGEEILLSFPLGTSRLKLTVRGVSAELEVNAVACPPPPFEITHAPTTIADLP